MIAPEADSSALLSLLVIATVLLIVAIVVERVSKRSPALRHTVIQVALAAIGLSPIIVSVTRLARSRGLLSMLSSVLSVGPLTFQPALLSGNEKPVFGAGHVSLANIVLAVWIAGVLISWPRLILVCSR